MVDVTSVRVVMLWQLLAVVKRVPSATQCSWWSELLDHAIRMCKLNASVGLSGRDTMSFHSVAYALGIGCVAEEEASCAADAC